MASLTEAHKPLSPFDPTQIYSAASKELIASEYVLIQQNDPEIPIQLSSLIRSIEEFIWIKFQLVGVDGNGKIPPLYVDSSKENAFYVPKSRFREEGFKFHNKFIQPAIVAHEYTHGIIENLCPLGNSQEAGAINEALADIVGVVFNQTYGGQPQNWSVGGLRDLSHPIWSKEKPKHYSIRATLKENEAPSPSNDFGYVHKNSEILSHAFFLASATLEHDSLHKATLMKIWFESVMNLQEGEKTFKALRDRTIEKAEKYGAIYKKAFVNAWKHVGLV